VLFPTTTFAIFFMVVLPLSWLLMPSGARWRPFMVAASYVFYSAWDWHFVFLLAFSTVWNHLFAVAIHRRTDERTRRGLLALAVTGDVALLGYFKYYDFFVTSTHNVFSYAGVDVPLAVRAIVLPVGISFFTFMAISYVVDTYRGDWEPTSFGRFATYLSFFPHLVAGPIVRPKELLPQFETPRDPRYVDTSRAFFLIATGLFKKVVIANYLAAHIVDPVFGAPNQHSSLEVLAAVYGYAVQIYADFSGYTDMAIGLALLLGFRFPQNFDSPYKARNVSEFWRRWNMTLSFWFRDYVFIPLGGSRGGRARTVRNLAITMLLAGLWHGAAWTFVLWGVYQGVLLVLCRPYAAAIDGWRGVRGVAAWFVMFHLTCLGWLIFRAGSLRDLVTLGRNLVTRFTPSAVDGVLLASLGLYVLPLVLIHLIEAHADDVLIVPRLPIAVRYFVYSATLYLILLFGNFGGAEFIYFQF